MEGREGMSSGEGGEVAGKFPQAAGIYSQTSGKAPENPNPVISSGAMVSPGMVMKKKRGRPRKYGPGTAMALALTPVSSSPGPMSPLSSGKRGRGRPPGSGNKQRLTGLARSSSDESASSTISEHMDLHDMGENLEDDCCTSRLENHADTRRLSEIWQLNGASCATTKGILKDGVLPKSYVGSCPVEVDAICSTKALKNSTPTTFDHDRARQRRIRISQVLQAARQSNQAAHTGLGQERHDPLQRDHCVTQQIHQIIPVQPSGEWVTNSAGAGFTPHVITIAAGEDITMKIMSISQQGPRAICILSANGAVSNVTLRQPDSSGGTLTYEGRFEILSLSGSFMLSEFGGTRSRTGGLSVSLASPDGRVIGGGVAGLLLAASPVQIVVGSFLPTEQKNKKPKPPVILGLPQMGSSGEPTAAVPISSAAVGETYGTRTQAAPQPNSTATAPYQGDGWSSLNPVTDSRHSTDINASLQGE
ncbi:AT-hook motif nuclear-localized protein 1 isoform X2 [Amborella trichopoda]|uniref:AT-hook motif nuclear-localized protein n=1 Tax=Amborella trichopoda TaxID=13333 RepID=W1PYV2_AMBTC|nr:AT-hook motif nuclear-localized protein 1 isoform X2 [Amborella trichopoda]ERN13289.1 hypothetical protein AMTR_s00041p00054250 [Amborella trichopoda]|eukprot:XP_020527546.1 AT-hook motif nuclear-localized protein 1 isoform X2 [Amborella trichopoda]